MSESNIVTTNPNRRDIYIQEVTPRPPSLGKAITLEFIPERVIVSNMESDTSPDGHPISAAATWWVTLTGPDNSITLFTSADDIPERYIPAIEAGYTAKQQWYSYHWLFGYRNFNEIESKCTLFDATTYNDAELVRSGDPLIFTLQPGESITMNSKVGEIDEVSEDCGVAPYYIPIVLKDDDGCMAITHTTFTYEEFADKRGNTEMKTVGTSNADVFDENSGCQLDIYYKILVR